MTRCTQGATFVLSQMCHGSYIVRDSTIGHYVNVLPIVENEINSCLFFDGLDRGPVWSTDRTTTLYQTRLAHVQIVELPLTVALTRLALSRLAPKRVPNGFISCDR